MASGNGAETSKPSHHEDDVLERIARIVSASDIRADERHIGDDAAVLRPPAGQMVISTDVCVANVHLDLSLFTLEDLGFKAMTSAISDIAAMGARVTHCVVGVISPPNTDLEALHRGLAQAATLTGCAIVGGDLVSGNDVSVAVTVIGEVPGGGAVLRSGARGGDVLFVTGPLGRAAAGLRRAREGVALDDELVVVHRRPWPRLAEGVATRAAGAHAMMDLSDGLALDLHRLADESGVGFALDEVPVAAGATTEEALSGGEDYELLLATPDADGLRRAFAERGLNEPIVIGRVIADVTRRTLRGEPFTRRGFLHEL